MAQKALCEGRITPAGKAPTPRILVGSIQYVLFIILVGSIQYVLFIILVGSIQYVLFIILAGSIQYVLFIILVGSNFWMNPILWSLRLTCSTILQNTERRNTDDQLFYNPIFQGRNEQTLRITKPCETVGVFTYGQLLDEVARKTMAVRIADILLIYSTASFYGI